MSDSLEVVGQVVDSLTTYLQERRWATNPQKSARSEPGVVWSGKAEVLPVAVINKVQAFLVSATSKQLQEY